MVDYGADIVETSALIGMHPKKLKRAIVEGASNIKMFCLGLCFILLVVGGLIICNYYIPSLEMYCKHINPEDSECVGLNLPTLSDPNVFD